MLYRFALMVILAALPVLAQPPRGFFNWWDSPIARDLNLTDDQNRQIRSIVREYRSKLIDQRATLEKAEIELEDQFNDEQFDQRKASDTLEKLISARGDLTRTMSQMGMKLRAVLTTDQFRELQKRRPSVAPRQAIRDQMQQRRMENRPGGMNRRNPPPPNAPPPNAQPPNAQPPNPPQE